MDFIINLDSKIATRIKELRKIHNLTQEQLADKLEISAKHVSSVERGVARLSLEKMIQLCAILDCSLDYLVLGKNHAGQEAYIPDTIIETMSSGSEREKAILSEYLSLYSKIKATGE